MHRYIFVDFRLSVCIYLNRLCGKVLTKGLRWIIMKRIIPADKNNNYPLLFSLYHCYLSFICNTDLMTSLISQSNHLQRIQNTNSKHHKNWQTSLSQGFAIHVDRCHWYLIYFSFYFYFEVFYKIFLSDVGPKYDQEQRKENEVIFIYTHARKL